MKKDYEERQSYPTDLTDEQWARIAHLFLGMREYKYSKRELLNALLYVVDSGCKWRQLPHDFPVWQTVYSFFRRATENGLWDKILQHLVDVTRKKEGRNPNPTYAIIDSQSVKTVYASEQVGFDGGKKNKGRKRHIVIDSLGCLLAVKVHRANLPDTKSGIFVAISAHRKYPSIQKYCGDGGYCGSFIANVQSVLNIEVDISKKIFPFGFHVLPKRWKVERTFAWLGNSRRLSKDFEIRTTTQEAIIKLSHSHTLLKRF